MFCISKNFCHCLVLTFWFVEGLSIVFAQPNGVAWSSNHYQLCDWGVSYVTNQCACVWVWLLILKKAWGQKRHLNIREIHTDPECATLVSYSQVYYQWPAPHCNSWCVLLFYIKQQKVNIKCVSFPIDESVLMDLKALLVEAKQKVPPVLQVLQTGDETMLDIGGESLSCSVMLFIYGLLCNHFVFSLKCSSNLIISSQIHRSVECLQTLCDLPDFFLQERGAVRSVAVWVIVLQTVPSWRPCRPSRSPTSGGKTTWLTAQWTSKGFFNRRMILQS